jgi:polyferredoxin
MDYDSPGAYRKNKLTVLVRDQTTRKTKWRCDTCHKWPNTLVIILRGGYVQEQLCLHCAKEVTACSGKLNHLNRQK